MTSSVHVKKLEVTEMKMCRWACGYTLRDHVRNDDIGESLKVENTTERFRKAKLRWFGYAKRRYQEYVARKTLKQRWMDFVNRDTTAVGTTKSEVH